VAIFELGFGNFTVCGFSFYSIYTSCSGAASPKFGGSKIFLGPKCLILGE